MRIVSDANTPFVREAFHALGEVVLLPAAALTPEAVRDADLLLVRSTVKVGEPLLRGSRVRFVGTATIGIDHLDTAWLNAAQIRWAAAPGSNADSVVQWLAAALSLVPDLEQRQLGIVGVGNVGRRVERLWRALLPRPPLLCDPPRARAEGAAGFLELDELLARCDLVTLHVPLTKTGADPTYRFFDARRLRPGAILVNACRGEVLDHALEVENPLLLDVFAGEPRPDPRLVERARLATPHIAGHSLDGKAAGTRLVYEAACAFLGVAPTWHPRDSLPPLDGPVVVSRRDDTVATALSAVAAGYDPTADDRALRALVAAGDDGTGFRRYREHYPVRRELGARTVRLCSRLPNVTRRLAAYGIEVEGPA